MSPLIRLVFCSSDLKLHSVLALGLGEEFKVTIESRGQAIKELVSRGECDVILLDIDPAYCAIDEQIDFFNEIADSTASILLMADDDARSTALRLVERGGFGYVRKPPSLPELKVM